MRARGIVLGLATSNHDRAACLVRDGRIVAAVAEERLDRRKRSDGFYGKSPGNIVLPPMAAIAYVLRAAGLQLGDVDLIVCGRSIACCREVVSSYLAIDSSRVIEPELPAHHLAHAYSTYATSPFQAADVLVIDEQGHVLDDGTFEKITWFEGAGDRVRLRRRFLGTHDDLSVGMLYDAFAAVVGLAEAGLPAAGKLMGLAATGTDRPDWPPLVHLLPDGGVSIPLSGLTEFFEGVGLRRRSRRSVRRLSDLADFEPSGWDTLLGADLATKAQKELERAVLHSAGRLHATTGGTQLCFAGGVALNCRASTRLREVGYRDVYVHPAATDDGIAVGLAMYGWLEVLEGQRASPTRFDPHTGRRYARSDCDRALSKYGMLTFAKEESVGAVAGDLARGEIAFWFDGRSEWGPRALGSRSILASPLVPGIRDRINREIKHREPFRPLGVVGIRAALRATIDVEGSPRSLTPYMLAVGRVLDQRLNPVRHSDGTLRFQFLDPRRDRRLYSLIQEFGRLTGLAILVNTSFNVFGEPLIETPDDAVRQFLMIGGRLLVLGERVLRCDAMPTDHWFTATRQAWADRPCDPLQLALAIDSAGHTCEAIRLLEQLGYSLDDSRRTSRSALFAHLSLLARRAAEVGDLEAARSHALEIIAHSSLLSETAEGLKYLTGLEDRTLAALVSVMCQPGGLLRLAHDVVTPAAARQEAT